LTIGILLIHLSPNNLYPETHEFVDRINSDTERTHTRFVARHGWILAIGDIKRLLRSTTLAGWTARRAVKAFPVWSLDDTPLLEQLNPYIRSQIRRQEKNRPGVWAEIRLREYIESSDQPVYRRPYRPSFWNLREYREATMLRLRSGRYMREDRQHGGYVRNVPITLELAAVYLLWVMPPKTQRLLERTGRLYKEDCWRPLITGVPFDQSPSAYLYPEHAPERPPIVGRVEEPKWNYQRLLADQPAHNARLGSYWSLGVASDGTVGLSKIIRSIGSLNIKTIEARNHMIANLEHDFSPRERRKIRTNVVSVRPH
jgi:hypothetical protein